MTQQPSKRARPSPTTLAAVLALLLLPLALAPRAQADEPYPGAIGRANLDGSDADTGFIPDVGGDALAGDVFLGIAVDAKHVYWAYRRSTDPFSFTYVSAIGRANLDGSGVDSNFISGLPGYGGGLAVSAQHVYWGNDSGGVGRANLDGTGVDQSFVTGIGLGRVSGVAVDGAHIYWAIIGTDPSDPPGIARANLDGTGVDTDFISGPRAYSLAIDAEHLYWTGSYAEPAFGYNGPSIGRANLDGTAVQERFIAGGAAWHPENWSGVAADDAHIYWTASGYAGTALPILRANLDGTAIEHLVPGAGDATNLAVDDSHIYWTHYDGGVSGHAFSAKRQTGKLGAVRVKVTAGERLKARAGGKLKLNPTYKLRPKTVELARGEKTTLRLSPKRKAQAKRVAAALKQGQQATADLTVQLTDRVGNGRTETLRVRLKR